MGWILGGVFILTTFVFIVIAVLFPEIVGIQGKIAKKLEEQHREENKPENKPEAPTIK